MIKINSNPIFFALVIIILISSQASAGCGRWVVRENTDYLADPITDAYFKDPEAINSQNANVSKNSNESGIDSATTQEILNDIPEVSGKWQIDLDKDWGYLNIFLIQTGDRFQGYGTLVEKGMEIPVTAIGTISEDSISLDANTVVDGTLNDIKKKYKLNLLLRDKMLAGSYKYFEEDRLKQQGNATAITI